MDDGVTPLLKRLLKKDPLRRGRPYSVSVIGGLRYYQQ